MNFWTIYIVGALGLMVCGMFFWHKAKNFVDNDGFFYQTLPAIVFATALLWPVMLPMLLAALAPYFFACIMIKMGESSGNDSFLD